MKIIRYVVRPRPSTIAGWYVWPVEVATHNLDCQCSAELAGIEQWASDPYALYPTKREATRVAKAMNERIKAR